LDDLGTSTTLESNKSPDTNAACQQPAAEATSARHKASL
jgi:hypothetical protein